MSQFEISVFMCGLFKDGSSNSLEILSIDILSENKNILAYNMSFGGVIRVGTFISTYLEIHI